MADNFNMKQFLMENKLGSYSRNTVKEEIEIKEAHTYQPGDMWSSNFDFKGMLKAGAMLNVSSDLDLMKAISDSFEDVNYHRENTHLQDAIDSKEAGDEAGVAEHLALFKNELKKTISQLKETQIFEREKIEEEKEDIVKNLTNSGRKIKDITAESGLKIMDNVINLGFKDQWMSDDVIKDAVIELLQHKTEVLRKYIGKDQLGHKMVRYNILLDDGVDQVDMEYVKKDDVSSTNEGVAAYEYEEGKEAGEKEAKMKENLSIQYQNLADLKRKLRIVVTDWMNEGFDKEDIKEYINDLIDEI
jgi:hypothetical protein